MRELLQYRTVQLFLVAVVLALVAIPLEDFDYIFITFRLTSFAIFMYLLVKLTNVKKKGNKK